MKKTKFPYRLWHWTIGFESLFELSRADLATFKLLAIEGFKP